jgi:hypothetical protein
MRLYSVEFINAKVVAVKITGVPRNIHPLQCIELLEKIENFPHEQIIHGFQSDGLDDQHHIIMFDAKLDINGGYPNFANNIRQELRPLTQERVEVHILHTLDMRRSQNQLFWEGCRYPSVVMPVYPDGKLLSEFQGGKQSKAVVKEQVKMNNRQPVASATKKDSPWKSPGSSSSNSNNSNSPPKSAQKAADLQFPPLGSNVGRNTK